MSIGSGLLGVSLSSIVVRIPRDRRLFVDGRKRGQGKSRISEISHTSGTDYEAKKGRGRTGRQLGTIPFENHIFVDSLSVAGGET